MGRISYTWIGAILALSVYFINIIFEFELFESFVRLLESAEHLEIDELFIPIFVFVIFLGIDTNKKMKEQAIFEQKNMLFKSMMRAVHHILHNFLNQMQFFRMEGERLGFPEETLKLHDTMIEDTLLQIEALGKVEDMTPEGIDKSIQFK